MAIPWYRKTSLEASLAIIFAESGMFTSLLNIVDSVLTLDEGCVRNDLISGDSVTIEGNYNREVSARISGVGSLACIYDREQKDKKFFIIIGKHKLLLTGDMDLTPKPQSLINHVRKSIRITADDAKFLDIRFNDARSFDNWLIHLGECLAEVMCVETVKSFGSQNAPTVSLLQHCISTCELLASPSKECVQQIHKIYEIKQRLHEVMRTLRTSPCDVSVKDIRWLKESCSNVPEMSTDPEMKFLLERLPNTRYTPGELQIILKDIIYADLQNLDTVVCAQATTQLSVSSARSSVADFATLANAVLIEDSSDGNINDGNATSLSTTQISASTVSQAMGTSNTHSNGCSTAQAPAKVPVHKKSRIALNGIEIQSNFKSPSSAGKALAKQIKIKSKFTTPAHRREIKTPKSKSPVNMNILADIHYNVPNPASSGSLDRNNFCSPVRQLSVVASQDKENCHLSASAGNSRRSPQLPDGEDNAKKISTTTTTAASQNQQQNKPTSKQVEPSTGQRENEEEEEKVPIETCTPFNPNNTNPTVNVLSAPAPVHSHAAQPTPASFVRTSSAVKLDAPAIECAATDHTLFIKASPMHQPPASVTTVMISSKIATPLPVAVKGSSPVLRKAPGVGGLQAALAAFPDAIGADNQMASIPLKAVVDAESVSAVKLAATATKPLGRCQQISTTPTPQQSCVAPHPSLPVPGTDATHNSRGKKSSADHAVRSPVRPLRTKPSAAASVLVSVPVASTAPAAAVVASGFPTPALRVSSSTTSDHSSISQPAPALLHPLGTLSSSSETVPALTPKKGKTLVEVTAKDPEYFKVSKWLVLAICLCAALCFGMARLMSVGAVPSIATPVGFAPERVAATSHSVQNPVQTVNVAGVEQAEKLMHPPLSPAPLAPTPTQAQPHSQGGFEMRVRYEGAPAASIHPTGDRSTNPNHINKASTAPRSSPSMDPHKYKHQQLQQSTYTRPDGNKNSDSVQLQSLVLQQKLRRLLAFLAIPVRAARSFLGSALFKFQQIKRVILN